MNAGRRLHLRAHLQQIAALALALCRHYVCDCRALGCVVHRATFQIGFKLKLLNVNANNLYVVIL